MNGWLTGIRPVELWTYVASIGLGQTITDGATFDAAVDEFVANFPGTIAADYTAVYADYDALNAAPAPPELPQPVR